MPEDGIKIVLGFDFGRRWTGIAVGQTLTAEARPLRAIQSNHLKPNWAAIGRLLETWQPQKLIVGLPTTLEGEPQKMTPVMQKFSRQLEGRFHISTDLVDERLTTREAHAIAMQSGRHQTKPEIDSIAAVLITESWLRSYHNRRQSNNRLIRHPGL